MLVRVTVALLLISACGHPRPDTRLPPGSGALQAGRGSIEGTVIDSRRTRLAGALIIARTSTPSIERTASTDDHGRYRIADLSPGTYDLTFYYQDLTLEHRVVEVKAAAVSVNDEQFDLEFARRLSS
jgi:hypothetical protein